MKAKVLWSACALSACFAACTNEDFLQESQNVENAVGQSEIVGHDLVSKGMRVIAVKGGADTRVNESGWEVNDQLGLAWYKVGKTIEEEQTDDAWKNLLSTGTGFAEDGTCDNIYANHIFTNVDGSSSAFETTTNVYQGAYFMYFPYQRLDAVKPLVLEPNAAAQTMDFREEVLNKSTWISAQDFLLAGEGVDENNQLERSFYLAPIVNAIGIDATPEEAISQNSFMSQLKITGLTLNLGEENKLFLPKAQVVTRFLPDVKYVAGSEEVVDEAATQKALYEATDKVADEKNNGSIYLYNKNPNDVYTSSLTTNVENPNFTLADTRQVRVFTFPTRNTTANWDNHAYALVRVKSPNGYNLGFFNVNVANSKDFIGKLEKILGADDAATLQKVHRKNNDVRPIANEMVANLLAEDFVPETYVSSEGQWNELMDLYDALYACGVRYHDGVGTKEDGEKDMPVIRIGGEVNFKGVNGTIKTPKNVTIKVISEEGKESNVMVIAANTVWPINLVTESDDILYMEVNKGITLTVGDNLKLDANIDNYGTVVAGRLTYIGTNDENGGKITNHYVGTAETPDRNNGRVEIEYGSYVYPADGDNGIVAYELTGEDNEAAMINRLVLGAKNTENRYAHVNTLVVPVGKTLNLNATSKGSINDDPYEGQETEGLNMPDLTNVDVELNGGSVFSDGTNTKVNNLYAVSGSSTATDIDVEDDITTLNGATLNVKSDNTPVKYTFDLENINNHGTLNANTDMTVEVVNNYADGTIRVASGYRIIYSVHGEAGYLQDGTAYGTIVEKTAYVPDADELEKCKKAVIDAWENSEGGSLKDVADFADDKTLGELASTIKGFANDDNAKRVNALIDALNKWFFVYYGDITHNVTKADITAGDLLDFENKTGYRFLN